MSILSVIDGGYLIRSSFWSAFNPIGWFVFRYHKVIISSVYDNRLILILAVNTLLLIIIPLSVLHWVIPDQMCTPIEGKLKKNNIFWNSASLSAFKTWNFKQGWYRGEINKFEHFWNVFIISIQGVHRGHIKKNQGIRLLFCFKKLEFMVPENKSGIPKSSI